MPTYQYACTACGHRFEAVQAFTDATLTECPECAGRLRKVFSAVGIVFKGSGFYRTDSRSGSATGAAAKKDTESSGSGSSGKADSGSSGSGSSSSSGSGSSSSSGSGSSGSGKSGSGSSGSGSSGSGSSSSAGSTSGAAKAS